MKKVYAVIGLVCVSVCASAQAPLVKQWDYRFGGTEDDALISFQQTKDGGYILGGSSNSNANGDKTQDRWDTSYYYHYDYWILKLDSSGNKQWDKRYGGISGSQGLNLLQQTSDGGYILGGISSSDSSGDKTQNARGAGDYWILKIDSVGNKEWDKQFGGDSYEYGGYTLQTLDGGYIIGGSSSSSVSGDKTQATWGSYDYWVIKTDSLGNKQWDKRFGGTGSDQLTCLINVKTGGYLLGGHSGSDSTGDKTQNGWGDHDFWVIKIDGFGRKQWDKRFGGAGNEELRSLQQTSDRGYILGGFSWSGNDGDKTQSSWGGCDYWMVKIDSFGNKQWDRRFGGVMNESRFGNISQTADEGYLLAGISYSNLSGDKSEDNLGNDQTWIVKTDNYGNKQWDKTLFLIAQEKNIGYAIQDKAGCFVIANYTIGDTGGYKTQPNWDSLRQSHDIWITKFCDSTQISDLETLTEDDVVSVYPNPSHSSWQLTVGNNLIGGVAEVFDAEGRLVFSSYILNPTSVIAPAVSRGVYLLRISSSKHSVTRKLVRL